MAHPHRELWLAYLGLTLTPLFWAANAVAARGTAGEIPPVTLAFWRWIIALLILLPIALPTLIAHRQIVRQYWRDMLPIAALSVGAFNTLLYVAAQTTTALNIALFNATLPIAVALMAWAVLGDAITRLEGIGIILGLFGMLVIITEAAPARLIGLDFAAGDLVMVAAVLCWASFSILLRRNRIPLPAMSFLLLQIILGLPFIIPFFIWESVAYGVYVPPLEIAWVFPFIAIFPGILAYAFWNRGVTFVGPARSAMFLYLVPVFAALLGGWLLNESLALFHAAGGLLILVGLYLAARPDTSRN